MLSLESLEERLTPAVTFVDLDGAGNIVITDGGDGQSGFNNDDITIFSDNANGQWIITDPNTDFSSSINGTGGNNTSTVTIPFSEVSGFQILVFGLDGNDSVTFDRSLGTFSKFCSFEGGNPSTGPGDSMTITGGPTVSSASVNYFSSSDGVILLDTEVYLYIGLEPLDLSGVPVTNMNFFLTAAGDDAILEDDGTAANNVVQLRSQNGSFETTLFQNPAGSLSVFMQDGNDTFNVSSISPPADFTSGLVVDGDADDDIINLNGPLSLGAKDVFLTAESIHVTAALVTTGDITATAATVITGSAGGSLQGNNLILTSGSSIASLANPLNIQANAILASTSGVGGIFLNEADTVDFANIVTFDGDVVIDAGVNVFATSVTAGGVGRNVRVRALTGALSLNSVTASGIVNLFAGGAISDANGALNNVTAQGLSLRAGAGAGTLADPLETTVSNLAANVTGDLNITNNGALTITSVTFLDSVTGITGAGSGNVQVTALSPITIAANVTSSGLIAFTATEIADAPNFLDFISVLAGVQVVSTGSDVNLQAGDDITLQAGSLIQAVAGSVFLTAGFTDADARGAINMGAGAIQAGINITLNARDDIQVSTVTANAIAGTVSITSTNGNIFDDGNNATVISGNTLTMTAVRSIGLPGATAMIDTTVNILTATTTGAGPFAGPPTPGIWVTDTDDLIVTSASTGDGVILIDAGTNLTVQTVTANGTGRNVRLRALGGNLTAGTVSATGDTVALSATAAILDGNAGANNVDALSLSLLAGAGIASPADPLETTVNNVAWSAGTGGIALINAGGLTITSVTAFGVTLTGGTGSGDATVTATSPLTVASNVIMGGNITLTAGEIADAPTFADDLTVNGGITVQSTGGNVTLQAGDDVILNTGSIVQAAGSVTLTAGFGDLDGGGGLLLNGSIISGANIIISGITDVCIGALTAPGLVSVTSTAGAIIDCNDPPAGTMNVTANQLLLQAATGIGAAGSIGTLETNINFLEASTVTGGIFLDDIGSYDVGGVDPGVNGVRNTGATGDINLAAAGTIRILNFGEVVTAPGLVTVTVGVDIFTSGGNPASLVNLYEGAICSSNNAVVLSAGNDVRIGFSNGDANIFNDYGDVRAFGNLTITAGRDIQIDENSYTDAGAGLAGGNLIATAGRDIRVLQTNARDSRFGTFGGTITLTTGPGGEFELNTGNNPGFNLYGVRSDLINLSTPGGPGGDITINADDVEIVDVEDVINAGGARVTIRPVTAGRPVDLGTNGTGSNLGLTQYELDRIVAGVVTIGSTTTGPITVTAAIAPTSFSILHLISGASITEAAGGTLQIANLAVEGAGGVTLNNGNNVGTLAGATVGSAFSFTNTTLLTVGIVDGIVGITTTGGNVTLTSPDISITQAINAGAGNVNLLATPVGAVIGVGTSVGTLGVTYGVSDAELALINSTGVITIGDGTNSGGIQVAGSESVGPASLSGKNVDLVTGQHITVNGSLTGANLLGLRAGMDINHTVAGVLGATILALDFGQDGSGATATITGTLQSPNPVVINSGVGDDTLLFNFTSTTALPLSGVFAFDFGGNDLLDGPDFNQVFTLTGANTGTLTPEGGSYQGSVDFFDYENLAGGTADDRFAFLAGGSVAGNIDGVAGGVNKLDYTNYGSAVTINLQTSTATAIGGTFANINVFCGFIAPGICSTLIGADVVNDWQITSFDTGTINAIPFVNFGTLVGGTNTDTFTFGAAGQLGCNIDGGAGTNSIVGNDADHTYSITGVNSGAIDTLFLGSVAPVLPSPIPTSIVTPPAPPTRFTNIQNLVAGAGDDRFFFVTPGSLAGTIDGGAGNNTLYGDNVGRTYTVTGGGTGNITGILPAGFSGVQNLIGGTGDDTIIVNSIGAVAMTLAGVQGNDVFTINGTGTAVLTASGGDGNDDFQMNSVGTGGATFNGDDGADRFAVRAIAGVTTINGGTGGESANVGSAATVAALGVGNLDGILAVLNLNMGSGATIINIGDQTAAAANAAVEVTNADITGFAPAAINYTASSGAGDSLALSLFASNLGDTFNVRSTLENPANPLSNLTTIQGGSGSDLFNLGSAANLLDDLLGRLSVQGNNAAGIDQVNFFDQGQTVAYTYALSSTTLTRTDGPVIIPAITYGGMELLDVLAGSGDDTFVVQAIGATTTANVVGNDGNDQFQITASTADALPASLTTNLLGGNGLDSFFVQSTAAATPGVVNMIGEGGDDQFSFPVAGILANGFIDGGDGIDTLDYSTYATGALVNLRPTAISTTSPLTPGQQKPGTQTPGLPTGVLGLQNQTASGLFNGALDTAGAAGRIAMATATDSTIENMVGSPFDDAFFGADEINRFEGRLGNDYAFGGAGNDILIGNEGDDTLFGEDGDDVIYGAGGRDAMYGGLGFDIILIDDCNDVRPGLNIGDRVLDVGGLGPVDGGVIDIVTRVPPLTGDINDPRINWSNTPLIVFQELLALRPTAITAAAQPVNSAPVLHSSHVATLSTVAKGSANPAGNTVASIVGSSITDVDGLSQLGIAISAASSANGQWQFSLNNGATWTNLGTVSSSSARLLRMTDLVRFVPKTTFTGKASISYSGWDQTTGTPGSTASLAQAGGKSAYSSAVDSATVQVSVINRAPVLKTNGTFVLPSIKANSIKPASVSVSTLIGKNVTDADAGALKGIAITSVDGSRGTWQYSVNAGKSWIALTTASADAAMLLRSTDLLRFVPKAGVTGPSSFGFSAWDRTLGTAGTLANLMLGTGGSTAFSTDQAFAHVQVGNTAPVLNTAAPFTLNPVTQGALKNAGTTVEALLGSSVSDPDLNAKRGIAVTGLSGTAFGKWQYSTNGGTTWKDMGVISTGSARLLRSQDVIRFVPNASFQGQVGLTFTAWDQYEGVAGALVKMATTSTAYSSASANASLTVG